jgi:hypothetical protein
MAAKRYHLDPGTHARAAIASFLSTGLSISSLVFCWFQWSDQYWGSSDFATRWGGSYKNVTELDIYLWKACDQDQDCEALVDFGTGWEITQACACICLSLNAVGLLIRGCSLDGSQVVGFVPSHCHLAAMLGGIGAIVGAMHERDKYDLNPSYGLGFGMAIITVLFTAVAWALNLSAGHLTFHWMTYRQRQLEDGFGTEVWIELLSLFIASCLSFLALVGVWFKWNTNGYENNAMEVLSLLDHNSTVEVYLFQVCTMHSKQCETIHVSAACSRLSINIFCHCCLAGSPCCVGGMGGHASLRCTLVHANFRSAMQVRHALSALTRFSNWICDECCEVCCTNAVLTTNWRSGR